MTLASRTNNSLAVNLSHRQTGGFILGTLFNIYAYYMILYYLTFTIGKCHKFVPLLFTENSVSNKRSVI